MYAKFKKLADLILDEACSETFNCAATEGLMKQLTEYMMAAEGITNFEFRKSGILQALEIFLTKTTSQAIIEREAIKNSESLSDSDALESQRIKEMRL